ncbi:Uncharacterised protein [Mycobacteroides abscessus subsp. abscessus]|nr:Uncharacterised protein [Mycobacteroides abscessus subsp. abscessus]
MNTADIHFGIACMRRLEVIFESLQKWVRLKNGLRINAKKFMRQD